MPKPWLAVVIGLILQPMVFLYVQRLRLFFAYFVAALFVGVIDWYLQSYFSALVNLVCAIHGFQIAKQFGPSKDRCWYSRWWGIPVAYLLLLSPLLVVRVFFFEPFSMPASSMSPYLNTGDHIIVKKQGFGNYGSYGVNLVEGGISDQLQLIKGGVYAFYPPHKDGVPYVKRLIGVGGDRVDVGVDGISINGEPLVTEFVARRGGASIFEETNAGETYQLRRSQSSQKQSTHLVPEGHYFFLGDNRDNSSDSRYWGAVPRNRLVGEVVYVFGR